MGILVGSDVVGGTDCGAKYGCSVARGDLEGLTRYDGAVDGSSVTRAIVGRREVTGIV